VIRCSSSLYFVYQFGPLQATNWCVHCLMSSTGLLYDKKLIHSKLLKFVREVQTRCTLASVLGSCLHMHKTYKKCKQLYVLKPHELCTSMTCQQANVVHMTCFTPLVYQTSCWKAGMKYIITGAQMSSLHITRAK
jgi:hypothetical protein